MQIPEPDYEILIDADCEKVLRKIARADRKLYARIDAAILSLAANPRPPQCRPLKTAHSTIYRIPVGRSWRILYAIIDDRLIVLLLDVTSREGAYDNLETLLDRLERFAPENRPPESE
jgi:mRNA interferase RelE/StbE